MSRTKPDYVSRFHPIIVPAIFILLVLALVACGPAATATPEPGPTNTEDQPEQFVPVMPSREHVPEGQSVAYSTTPPTSGPHWPRWERCGIYRQEIPDELLVHNLEHGNIVVSYHLADEAEVARLEEAVVAIGIFADWGILRPYPHISEGTVAVTAWGVIDTFQGVDQERLAGFFQRHAGQRGPETIPCS